MAELTNNPYAAPTAEVGDIYDYSGGTQPAKVFATSGRIGRMRWIVWNFIVSMVCIVLAGVLGGVAGATASDTNVGMLGNIAMIPYWVFLLASSIQRSHDMDWSGWTAIIAFIPLVGLIWLFKAGTDGPNRFGPPPEPNGMFVKIVFWGLVVLMVLGIVGGAYMAYTGYGGMGKS